MTTSDQGRVHHSAACWIPCGGWETTTCIELLYEDLVHWANVLWMPNPISRRDDANVTSTAEG